MASSIWLYNSTVGTPSAGGWTRTGTVVALTTGSDTLGSNFLPTDETYTLGDATHRWVETFTERVTMKLGSAAQSDIYVDSDGDFEIDAGNEMFLYAADIITINAENNVIKMLGVVGGQGATGSLTLKPTVDLNNQWNLFSFVHAGDTDRNEIHTQMYAQTDATSHFAEGAHVIGVRNAAGTLKDITTFGAAGTFSEADVLSTYIMYWYNAVSDNVIMSVDQTAAAAVQFGAGYSLSVPAAITFGTGLYTSEGAVPSAPAANGVVIYAVDNGGKTELLARFNTGASQRIAIQP